MNWRAFWALLRREVRRGRRGMAIFTAIAGVSIMLTLVLSEEGAIMAAAFGVLAGMFAALAPLGDLREDKTLGHLEFDRVLPVPHRVIATARLFGAAVRTAPLILTAVPFIIAMDRGHEFTIARLAIAVTVPFAPWLLFTSFTWAMMAVNIRWNLRGLWWLPMTIIIGPNIVISALPAGAKAAIQGWVERTGTPILDFAATPPGVSLLILVLFTIPLALFWLAISLFAAGLERYSFDASGAVALLGAPPKRELAAIGRGPALAVSRFCIRLATEQSRKRLILLAVFVLLLLFGSEEMKGYARFYVRALAAMIPGGIALHLSVARTRGHLEGIQQLPHPAITIGAGYLLGIAALAAPGAAVWALARAVTGMPATVTNVLSLWAWMIAWTWFACITVVWVTSRRLLMIAAVPVLVLVSWVGYVGFERFTLTTIAIGRAFTGFRAAAGAALPLSVAGAMMVAGLPLFARGLNQYEFAGAKAAGWFGRWQERARNRRGFGSQ